MRLKRSGLVTSQLGFGTSRLHYVAATRRERLLRSVLDLGIVHIDTAPLYGDSLAEVEIGRVLQTNRNRLVIVTKYGLPPNALMASAPALAPPLRAVRAVTRRLGLHRSSRPPMTAAGLRASVEGSLKRLRTDYVDAVLLHEPGPTTLQGFEEITTEVERLRRAGMVRYFGVAGPWRPISRLGDAFQRFVEILQTSEQDWQDDRPPDISYGVLSGGAQAFGVRSVSEDVAVQRLRAALRRRPERVILISTTDPAHLARLSEVAEEFEQ